ncbi:hypothetical protein TSUD_73780 [Trifolium subterraneum]|uniref:Uncharacterized protein n=1 Tax=Trifolium subterraneum TaxID=3900 RepID=A0A2Z6LGX4_TRISU|nr:hypothetical protein TSUD_73780 [Trifolium subterraneum]
MSQFSSGYYLQAYDPSTSTHAAVHHQLPKMYQNPNAILTSPSSSSSSLWPSNSHAALQQTSMSYLSNSSHQVPNNSMWQQLPQPSNNIPHANGFGMFGNNTMLPLQQEQYHVPQINDASVHQTSLKVSGTNSRFGINSSFNSNLNANFRNTLGGSFLSGSSSNQIPMTQPLPMSSLPINALGSLRGVSPFSAANIGNSTNANTPMSSFPIDASGSLRGVSPFFTADIGNSISTNANTTRAEEPNSIYGSTMGNQISMAQPLPMSSLPIDASSSLRGVSAFGAADVGGTNVNTIRGSEEAELNDIFGSLQDYLMD